jgi:ABC-2 type transport system permease protein
MVVGAAFLLRAVGDASQPGGNVVSWLSTPFRLAVRQQRASAVGGAVGLFVFVVATGSLSDSGDDAVPENLAMGEMFARNVLDPTDGCYSTMALFSALMIGVFAVTSVLRLRSEERSGHTEAVLATAARRRRWISAWIGFTVLASIVPFAGLDAGPLVILTVIAAGLGFLGHVRFPWRVLDAP